MAAESEVTIRVSLGEVRGRRRRTVYGVTYFSFQGIPYAAPPVGPLRFKPPQPAAAWKGVLDATKEGNVAPQISPITLQYEGDEDCLFLNIATPKLPSEVSGGLLPVMFHIHGGGLVVMSGNEEHWGPDYLIPHGVLNVSINYRLGVLGFASTGDSVIPGNMGFKDQVMALRWVRENIRDFGGDPDNITIFGCSAGGLSGHAHMLSPMSKGLFSRVIAQSATALGDGFYSDRVPDRTRALVAHLGLRTQDSREVADFLRRQPAELLVKSTLEGRIPDDVARGVMFPFMGTVEPEDAEGGAFYPRDPADIMRSGEIQQVPFIAGVAEFEGSVFAQSVTTGYTSGDSESLKLLIPTNLRCPDSERKAVAEEIRRFYFGERQIGPDTMKVLWGLLSDLVIVYPSVNAVNTHSSKSSAPVYFYIIDAVTEMEKKPFYSAIANHQEELLTVAIHGACVPYIWHPNFMTEAGEPGSSDWKLSNKLTRIWTNFAKTGVPTDPGLEVSWPSFSAKEGAYLQISRDKLSVSHHPFADIFSFWDKLYKKYNS